VKLLVLTLVPALLFGCSHPDPPVLAPPKSDEPTPTVVLSTVPPTDPAGAPAPSSRLPLRPKHAIRGRVLRVTDGDTIVVSGIDVGEIDRSTGGRKARLIGIDTPEVHGQDECFGRQASAFTDRALDGSDIWIDLDVDPLDRYGRALVYVWQTDGTFFNARIVREGYAQQATFPPNVRYVDLFTRLAREARENDRGLWSACS
jgi:micrococcal nuclease